MLQCVVVRDSQLATVSRLSDCGVLNLQQDICITYPPPSAPLRLSEEGAGGMEGQRPGRSPESCETMSSRHGIAAVLAHEL